MTASSLRVKDKVRQRCESTETKSCAFHSFQVSHRQVNPRLTSSLQIEIRHDLQPPQTLLAPEKLSAPNRSTPTISIYQLPSLAAEYYENALPLPRKATPTAILQTTSLILVLAPIMVYSILRELSAQSAAKRYTRDSVSSPMAYHHATNTINNTFNSLTRKIFIVLVTPSSRPPVLRY